MKKIEYYFLLLLLINIFSGEDKIYRIKFGLLNVKNFDIDSDLINNIFYNKIYLNLSIGTSVQTVPFELDNGVQTFCVTNDVFNAKQSSTYENISQKEIEINYEVTRKGYLSKDILNINDNSKKINFILGTQIPYRLSKLGIIGLRIPYLVHEGVFPFFSSLKDAGLINSFIWTLKFFDNISLFEQITYDKNKENIIGEFIFGGKPSKYENDSHKYNDNAYYTINLSPSLDIRLWQFNFSKIYINLKEGENISQIEYQDDKNAEISIKYSFISGPQYFLYFLEEHYLYSPLVDGLCTEEVIDFYTYLECDSSFKPETFPNISFVQRDFEYIFNLTYEDLFVFDEKKQKYIFLILIRDNSMLWELGTIFLRKFQFVFDENNKVIGMYKYYEGDDKEQKDNDGNNHDNPDSNIMKIVLIVSLSVIFAALLIFIGMFIQKKCNKNRKKRANELKENFEYVSENTDENGLAINGDKKIIKEEK